MSWNVDRGVRLMKEYVREVKLTPSEKFVLLAIVATTRESGWSYESYESLGDVGGLHRQTVIKAVKKLEALGAIRIMRNRTRPNAYRPVFMGGELHLKVVEGG